MKKRRLRRELTGFEQKDFNLTAPPDHCDTRYSRLLQYHRLFPTGNYRRTSIKDMRLYDIKATFQIRNICEIPESTIPDPSESA